MRLKQLPPIASPKDTQHARMVSDVLNSHARTCKHSPTDCAVCVRNMAWYASLGLPMLSAVLADRPTVKTTIKVSALT